MSLINVTNIKIGNNVCSIKLPLIFQIEFECLEDLKHDVEWKVIYITSDGSGYVNSTSNSEGNTDNSVDNMMEQEKEYLVSNNKGEIILDAVCLGPLYKGILEFEFRVNPPNFSRLRPESVLGMQAILISGNYCDQEFIRIGYYTNNVYDEESLVENPPDLPILDKIVRCIIDQPRVTRFPIKWDNDNLIDFEGNNLNYVINSDTDSNTTEDNVDTNTTDTMDGNTTEDNVDTNTTDTMDGNTTEDNVDTNTTDTVDTNTTEDTVEYTEEVRKRRYEEI